MEIIKSLKDYSKTPLEKNLCQYFERELSTTICAEKIKNKKFMLEYIQPLNDFIIYTTVLPCSNFQRIES